MWEILLQLRVLLPYLTRIVPLIEPFLDRSGQKPELTALSDNLTAIQTSSRDLEVQARNQALQLERLEQQLSRLRTALEANSEENRTLARELRESRKRLTILASFGLALLLGVAAMVLILLVHAR
jgi:predicted  nucleic acid-binding Zn-ribbon protein